VAQAKLRGVLLCEDKEHERFFRRLLARWFGRGKLYVSRIPNRQGAGDAWVMERYATEIQKARQYRNENYALIVVVDGDRFKVPERKRQLNQQLEKGGLDKRRRNERVALCIPTRNIETWELWLCGDREIEENSDYKARYQKAVRRGEKLTKKAVEAWFHHLSPEASKAEKRNVPSLADGRLEIQRFD